MSPVPFAEALRFWFKLGCISFGGPAGQIALMHRVLVEEKRWISEARFLHALNYCMLLPGPEAQQLATYLGWLMHRSLGGVVAGLLFILPSLLLLLALSWLYLAYGDTALLGGVFYGIRPAVTAIVLHAAWRIGGKTLRHPALWLLAAASFAALALGRLPFPLLLLTAAGIGWGLGRWHPAWLGNIHGQPEKMAKPARPALIDDAWQAPHTRFRRSRLLAVVAIGGGLWLCGMLGLSAAFGCDHLLPQLAGFFTQAALLTFGGAYAVLPYVQQAAVAHYGWLSGSQMIDGLALGETTPGPLIMVVAFVGFVAGWNGQPLGSEQVLAGALLGGLVATAFTFLPSFIFILAGAPLVESTRGDWRLQAPLTAITAAVVGVIAHLALYFASETLWPAGHFDGLALAVLLGAALALWRGLGVLPVIAVCAGLGALKALSG
ncbi:chromate efflux transporter [Dechloromonas sp. ZY10]|uniref:chromate efflux transporter n=1 Tax=Dechloromonas aquae TaxID=2664436 RepID=UPI00352924CF